MENWFEEQKKRQKENRRNLNLVFTGNYRAIINSIIEFYEDEENIDKYEICLNGSVIVDNEHLYRLCKNIKDTMIHKSDYENVKKNNAEFSKRYQKEHQAYCRLLNDIQNIDREIRKNEIIQNLESYRDRLLNENLDLEQKVNELEKSIEKWKSMYTGQCEANKKLINLLGDK